MPGVAVIFTEAVVVPFAMPAVSQDALEVMVKFVEVAAAMLIACVEAAVSEG